MRLLRYNVAVSLDGFIAPPDESTDWIVEDQDIDFSALYAEFDTFIMGRKTYEIMVAQGERNPLHKRSKDSVIVVSHQMDPRDFPHITLLKGGFLDYIKDLKEKDGKDIWLMGGGQLAAPCLEAGLVDSVEAAIMPSLLGQGVKMVAGGPSQTQKSFRLELRKVERLQKSGILMCKYTVMDERNG